MEILEKRERTLRHAIMNNLSQKKKLRAATGVREAQLQAIEAKRAQIMPTDFERRDILLNAFTQQETRWRNLSDEEIIEKYSN